MARKSRKTETMQEAPEIREIVFDTALYVRLSIMDSGKKDGESIINQQELLEQYVAARPELTIKKVFVDNGETGVDFVRPAWNELMSDSRAGKINCIVVKDLSRIGRNYIETGEYLDKIFPLLGVRVIAVNDGYDNISLTTGEQLVANLKNLVNDIHSKDISRKVAASAHSRRQQGLFCGAYPMYGYLKDPADKHKIIVDPETAPIVRQIFQWKADGMGNAAIARKLNGAGIPSPNTYRYAKGIVKDKKYEHALWSISGVTGIMRSPIYLGHMTQGKSTKSIAEGRTQKALVKESDWVVVKNTHEPIVTQEIFDKAHAVMDERTESYKAVQGKNAGITITQILKGLVYCGDCGAPLSLVKNVKDGNRVYWTYQCRNHNMIMACPRKYAHESEVVNTVYDAIRLEIQKSSEINILIEKLNSEKSYKKRLDRFDIEIDEAEREIKRIASLRQAVYEDYAAKMLTVSEYQFATSKYDADAKKQQQRLESAKLDKAEFVQTSTPTNKWFAAFSRFMDSKELTAEMVQALVERVVIKSYNRVDVLFKFRDEFAAISEYSNFKEVA